MSFSPSAAAARVSGGHDSDRRAATAGTRGSIAVVSRQTAAIERTQRTDRRQCIGRREART